MYKHFIFDLYGTLIDLRTNEKKAGLWKELAKFYRYHGADYDAETLKTDYLAEVKRRLAAIIHTKHPDIMISAVFAYLYQQKGVSPEKLLIQSTTVLFRTLSLDYLTLYDGVLETLDWLRERGGRLYILSNGQREFSLPELQQLGLFGRFDGMYFSADYEVCKPDAHFMEMLLGDHKIEVNETVMIGNDHTTDLEVARRVGMDAAYIHTNCSRRVKRVNSKYQIWDGDFRKLKRFFAE